MAESSFDMARSSALRLPHGFFGHANGAHQFGYGGEGNPELIGRTRAGAAQSLVRDGVLAAPHQVHSPDVVTVTESWGDPPEGRPVADALVTDRPGIVLGIVTADCAPVLFADREARVIGAAHAGWRGAHGGVLENTVDAMEALGAQRASMVAAIGPTIAQQSYEVDQTFRDQFDESFDRFFRPGKTGHWQYDLPAYVTWRLRNAGLEQVDDLGLDTYALGDRFYSYRRATHEGAPNYGRQISLIALA